MAIEFSCQCGNVFRLHEDEAGAEIQCPKCGRLNDVPLPSDLKQIAEDGTFALDAPPVLHDPAKAAELLYVYSKHEWDVDGYQKDMRLSDEEAQDIGVGEQKHIADQKVTPHGPKYDPETGELVQEFELAPRAKRAPIGGAADPTIPLAAIGYATGDLGPGRLTMGTAFVKLFEPGNLAVMGALWFMHLFSVPLVGLMFKGFIFLGFAIPVFVVGMVGHYGNIVDDVGPSDKDELPRPFRDLHFYDDLWMPFCNVLGAAMLSYFPVLLAVGLAVNDVVHPLVALMIATVLVGLGSFVYPAVFLTLQTSGTPVNLRPDRVMRVIAVSGPMYFVVTALWIAAMLSYMWGTFGSLIGIDYFLNSAGLAWPIRFTVTMPALIVGIFLMHYFCVCLGLLYRAHHADFEWAFQHHVRSTPQGVTTAPRTPRRQPTPPQSRK